MKKLKMAVMGAGSIAGTMAATIQEMDGIEPCAVASRSLSRAESFKEKYGFLKAYGSYEEMAEDKEVELVYVATPHSEHYNNTLLCLKHGKHVLCEKAFAVNEKEALDMISLAREKKLLLAEAMWVRYMPMARTLTEVLSSGLIGNPFMLTANLGYLIDQVDRLNNPALAGGALLDVGVYTLTFASIAFGNNVKDISAAAVMTDSGVDAQNSITLSYEDGKMAVLNSSMKVLSDRQGIISGTAGFLVVENINNFESIRVYDTNRRLVKEYLQPKQISGYEYQVLACKAAIEQGLTECPLMPHEETLAIMRWMDTARSQWGLKYPME